MRTFEIKIQTEREADKEFIGVFKNLQAGKKVKFIKGVYFTSLEAVRNLLTEKRLELLRLIREKHPHSIYELAKISGRNFRNVHDDMQILKNYGLVQMSKAKDVKRAPYRKIEVPYQGISIYAGI